MVQRFNQTLLKILGTLEEHQKQGWMSYVASRLATDGYLRLNSSQESDCSSSEHFASKLKNAWTLPTRQHLKETNTSATRHKSNYEGKVREATLNVWGQNAY